MSRRDKGIQRQNQPSGEIRMVAQQFSGPLPPPALLEKYNEIVPGAAERIITMAESQHTHRQSLETNVVNNNISAQKWGLALGFIVSMTAIVGGIVLISMGREASGLTSIISALAALAGVFVYGKWAQKKDLGEKKN